MKNQIQKVSQSKIDLKAISRDFIPGPHSDK